LVARRPLSTIHSLRTAIVGWLGVGLWAATALAVAEPSKLTATCYGAAGEVSGSLHVLDTGNGRWMIDCGAVLDKNRPALAADDAIADEREAALTPQALPAGLESVSAAFLTHAHADHLGRLPLLVDRGFSGPIYMTEATAALAGPALRVLLRCDRATIRHWSWSKERRVRAEDTGKSLWVHWRGCKYRQAIAAESVEQATCSAQELFDRLGGQAPRLRAALCSECVDDEIAAVLRHARRVQYRVVTEVAPGVRVMFLEAGHIPGAASVLFEVELGGKKPAERLPSPIGRGAGGEGGGNTDRFQSGASPPNALTLALSQRERGPQTIGRVLFSGDLGNGLSPLLPAPKPGPEVDAVFVESVYGPIVRKAAVKEQRSAFRRALAESVGQGGITWIPCFALHRTQQILYELHLAQQEKLLPERLPIYCPSPTAKEATALYRENQRRGWFSAEIAAEADAFSPRDVRTTVPSGKRLPRPAIVISTGDMLVAPWMRQLLSVLLPEPSTHILLVAYQPAGSAGELLLHGATKLDIDGEAIPVRAKVQPFSCFSGHADAAEIDTWLGAIAKDSTVILVHGDKAELEGRAEQLRRQGRRRVIVAKPEEAIDLLP
jgi:metallo-beta-lactamase family protein